MARPTDLQRSETFKNTVDSWTTIADTIVRSGKVIGEEGLFLALGTDIFFVTGEVHEDQEILFEQRKALNSLFKDGGFLDQLKISVSIPFTNIKIPNPLIPMIKMIKPYGKPLTKKRIEDGKEIFEAIDPISRATLSLIIPGILKLFIKLLPEVVPG